MNLKKVISVNLLILFIIFCITELISYVILCNRYKNEIISFVKIITGKEIKIPYLYYTKVFTNDEIYIKNLRPVEYKKSGKKPVVLFGCSYTHGFGLEENETFSKKLSDYTDRTVYNRGQIGTGIPFMYYQLADDKITKDLPSDAEYVIYTLIPDHFPRMFRYRNFVMTGDHTIRYKISNNKLVRDKAKFPFLHSLFTGIIAEEYVARKNSLDDEKTEKLFIKLMSESYKLIKKKMPDAKFIILYYESMIDEQGLYDDKLNMLKDIFDDIEIIKVRELCPEIYQDDSYWLTDNDHPSAKAWDKIIPELCKKIK